jgi:uncharacterized protein
MTVLRDPGGFHEDGRRDARRHHDRVRRQIAEQLRERIGDEDLITAGPERRVRVPVTGEREWRFIFDRGQQDGVGQSGDVSPGDRIGAGDPRPAQGDGDASAEGGEVRYEVELDMEEVEQHLFEQLGLPRLAPRTRESEETEAVSWDDRARKGALLDKKATLRANLRRNAASGRAAIGDLDRDDLRYLTSREQRRPRSRAVVFLLMDVSGSMGAFEKRVARLFFWWATRFLRRRYATLELVFVAHHTEAIECSEEQFFTRVESGGTRCSSAYELVLDIQRRRYPVADWNVYVAHCSDGDNWADDNPRLLELLEETAAVANLVGYVQIDRTKRYHWGGPHLYGLLLARNLEGVVTASVASDREIWSALRTVFAPEPEALLR